MNKKLVLLLCLFVLMGLMFGCSQADNNAADSKEPSGSAEPSGGSKYKQEVIVGVSDSCSDMDPQASGRIANKTVYKMIYDTLFRLDESNGELIPAIAERFEQNDDTTYTFYLRKDAKFHNGEPVKASDVIFTLERGKKSPFTGPTCKLATELSAPDDYTVVMKLESPDAEWVQKLCDFTLPILSEKAVTEDPNNGTAIGSGAYVLDKFELNDYITMYKFEDYWDAENIKTERFKFRYIPENSARLVALQNGEIDFCMNPANSETHYIAEDPNLELYQIDGTNTQYLAFNTQRPPFDNKKVRQAIAYAVNKEDIIAVAMEGFASPAKTFWGHTSFGYYDGFEGYDYNPEKAKALLAEAGYPDGLDMGLICINVGAVASEVLQAQLKEIGVNVKINEMETAGIVSSHQDGEYDTTWYGHSFTALADSVVKLYISDSGDNRAKYINPTVDEKIYLAPTINDDTERYQVYKEVQEIAADEVPYIPMYYRVVSWGTVKGFEGVIPDSGMMHDLSHSYVLE